MRTTSPIISEALKELLWPTRCVGCGCHGELLCRECRQQIAYIDQEHACRQCGAPYGWMLCTECEGKWETDAIICACSFEGPARKLITVYKDEYELRLAPLIAELMEEALGAACNQDTFLASAPFDGIAFVPATSQAYARRGFDHMELIARCLAQRTSIPLMDVLVRHSSRDQRKLTKEQRFVNLQDSVEVYGSVYGARILVVDDVLTTGASMRACAHALKMRGAREVFGLSLCRVW